MVFLWHFFASYSNGTSRGFYSPLPRYVTRCRDVFRVSGRVCTELFVATVITQVDTWTKESTRINKSSNSCSLLTNSLALSSILVQFFFGIEPAQIWTTAFARLAHRRIQGLPIHSACMTVRLWWSLEDEEKSCQTLLFTLALTQSVKCSFCLCSQVQGGLSEMVPWRVRL